MKKIAFAAVLLAGIVGWAVRDDASSKPSSASAGSPAPGARLSREQVAQKVKDNGPTRDRLQKQYPEAWRDLAKQTRRDIATCVVTEYMPGVLKADCL
jgi:hypothetical protein